MLLQVSLHELESCNCGYSAQLSRDINLERERAISTTVGRKVGMLDRNLKTVEQDMLKDR